MNKEQRQVKEFMLGCGQKVPDRPIVPDDKTLILRARLILEKALEYCDAAGIQITLDNSDNNLVNINSLVFKPVNEIDPVAMADALVDIKYVTNGAACAQGLDLEPLEFAVHLNNMTKLDGGYTDEFGKFRKGPNYKPIDLTDLIEEQKNPSPKASFHNGPQHTSLGNV